MPDFPLFELVGPPCEVEGCAGVLIHMINMKARESLYRCSVCPTEFYKMPLADAMDHAIRMIERAHSGVKLD